ncbi:MULTISPECIES: glycosyltransferase [unclassified Lysobacter]|uniref:glycosyltransferase n=1 Tax=unclassified Lysobacter TaxID=2635362 RepID=UPI001BEC9910|nr:MULTISPECIES: glycosyltransferase [unclassified Lysobacter]MBT2747920.1 glycosyltransferase [Lysobacter sp. ISL-42]MBT2753740.1 glycosyltransferase [Lysobacter sp. ISL-50]MBT2779237.1 glycosyltransferase [Lysobacter sp. ISL-54]
MIAQTLIVAGLRTSGSGYPNAEQTLKLLRAHEVVRIRDLGRELPPHLHLWTLRHLSPLKQLRALAGLGLGNLRSLLRVLWAARGGESVPVYVPYPSVFFMWLASWLPRGIRPYCIVDAYISVWDSMFRDRDRSSGGSVASRWIKRFEARALRAASMVLVDTEANRLSMIDDFGLQPRQVRSLPLAIDEAPFLAMPSGAEDSHEPLRVLFVGTLIPLHGVPTILSAIQLLLNDERHAGRFHFRFIGDGQLGPALSEFIAEHDAAQASWVRQWQSLETLAAEIAEADICLGVFGGEGKAARVLPFKLYMYLAAGRAIVSQGKMSLPHAVPAPPLLAVETADASDLARALASLAEDSSRRYSLARQARGYFTEHLAGARVVCAWRSILQRE